MIPATQPGAGTFLPYSIHTNHNTQGVPTVQTTTNNVTVYTLRTTPHHMTYLRETFPTVAFDRRDVGTWTATVPAEDVERFKTHCSVRPGNVQLIEPEPVRKVGEFFALAESGRCTILRRIAENARNAEYATTYNGIDDADQMCAILNAYHGTEKEPELERGQVWEDSTGERCWHIIEVDAHEMRVTVDQVALCISGGYVTIRPGYVWHPSQFAQTGMRLVVTMKWPSEL